jgi:hypothetical protein
MEENKMSNITIDDVRDGQATLGDTSLDYIIPNLITEAEDLIIVQLSYLDDIDDLVNPVDSSDTPKAIDLLVLYKAREMSFNSYYGSLDNQQSLLWQDKYNKLMSDVRKGYIEIGTTNATKSMATAEMG